MKDLFQRYDIPAPRYTSYPTVPYWSEPPSNQEWLESLGQSWQECAGWSLYIHVPFCETLCTFCGCNTSITKNHKHEDPYVELVLKEFAIYREKFERMDQVPIRQFHLGGGTPTFLSAANLKRLVGEILVTCQVDSTNFEGSLEVDPRRTTKDQLEVLAELGFQRISLGVQDFNLKVQEIVNRVQSFELTQKITQDARDLGYESVNYDLIYGLPLQTPETVKDMTLKTLDLRPDRIALYSFAKVPWIKPAQRLFKDEDVPEGEAKRDLYEIARTLLLNSGYVEIGMDHFALPHDALALANDKGELHRNFMGYCDQRTDILLGLGVSSISETPNCFHQNEKSLPVYKQKILSGEIPTLRGHKLSAEDRSQRQKILKFMTSQQVELPSRDKPDIDSYLRTMFEDGLIEWQGDVLRLTERGRPFLRNACMALDLRLRRSAPERQVFSQSL